MIFGYINLWLDTAMCIINNNLGKDIKWNLHEYVEVGNYIRLLL